MTQAAKFISVLFHPAFMPLVGIFIIFNTGIYSTDVPWEVEKYTYLLVALFSILLPFSVLPVFYYWKLISNFELSERRERIIPIAVASFCLIALHIFLSRIIPLQIITAFTFALASISIALLFINIFYKISMHMLGIGGITGLILAITIIYSSSPFYMLAISILIAGIAGSARLKLDAHTPTQILTGYLFGTIGMLFTLLLLLQ
jgi:hypothetical protein